MINQTSSNRMRPMSFDKGMNSHSYLMRFCQTSQNDKAYFHDDSMCEEMKSHECDTPHHGDISLYFNLR